MTTPTIGIGSTVYIFDENHREYYEGSIDWPGPVYRKHFVPQQIIGETSRSWVLENGTKINKRTLEGCYPDEAGVDQKCWVHTHCHRIANGVRQLRMDDGAYDKLKAIAGIIGYQG